MRMWPNNSEHPIDPPKNFFARWEGSSQFWFGGVPMLLLATLAMIVLGPVACFKPSPEVVIYAAQDQEFAEPILKQFEKQTGIKVRAVYDSEAVKTVALANRLLAEASHSRCDVWWSNEALRTRQQIRRVQRFGQPNPNTHSSLRLGKRRAGGQILTASLQSSLKPLTSKRARAIHVLG